MESYAIRRYHPNLIASSIYSEFVIRWSTGQLRTLMLEDVCKENENVKMNVSAYLDERFSNEDIQEKLRMIVIDKMKEGRLRWFGYVKNRSTYVLVKRCERFDSRDEQRQRYVKEVLGRGF